MRPVPTNPRSKKANESVPPAARGADGASGWGGLKQRGWLEVAWGISRGVGG